MAGSNAAIRSRRWVLGAIGLVAVVAWALLAPASSLAASAGLKPSQAPLVAVGQHYFGDASHANNAGYGSADLWLLPPLLTGDAVTIAWHSSEAYGPYFCLVQGIDDYSWAEENNRCNASQKYFVAGNGSARSAVEAKSATSGMFLEFLGNSSSYGQPYDFTIESIQHAIGASLAATRQITPTSTLGGSANLSDGSPVPDGLAFTLSANWVTPGNKASHSRTYMAASSGGSLSFPLSLPANTEGKKVSFTVTRPADPNYLAVAAQAVEIPVAVVVPPAAKPHPGHHAAHRCRRHFKKRMVRGHLRCVRKHRHRW